MPNPWKKETKCRDVSLLGEPPMPLARWTTTLPTHRIVAAEGIATPQ